jgi:hypothetical protein
MGLKFGESRPAEGFPTTPHAKGAGTMAVDKRLVDDEPDEKYGLIPIRWLTDEEGFAVLDSEARRGLNMSGEEFLRRWKADDFSDEFKVEHHPAFAALSILVKPFAE